MESTRRATALLAACLVAVAIAASDARSQDEIALLPEIEPFETGYLKVSDIHEIYYELCGNPKGTPVFVLHGGPGASCSPYMRRFFDPAKFLIVLHDQRGCGKSRPFAETKENTTQALVADIEQLRKHLKLGKVILFGGSWGTTLGLAYGEAYPEHVCGMLLRGIFTATNDEIDYYYHGGVRTFFPDAYDDLIAALPDPKRRPLANYLSELIQRSDSTGQWKYSKAWARYEIRIGALQPSTEYLLRLEAPSPAMVKGIRTLGLFENYYMANRCFLEEGQLWRDLSRIRDVPVTLVNGRYDAICPPVTAYRLHQELPRSTLVIAEGAGHWMGDKPVEQALLKAARDMESVACPAPPGR